MKRSPDGTCLLSNSEDNTVKLFELPITEFSPLHSEPPETPKTCEFLNPALTIMEGESIYDYCWFPKMNSIEPSTCAFLTTSAYHPVHLWDAFQGKLIGSYRSYNDMDELDYAFSVTFNGKGDRIYCGYNDMIRIFDISVPSERALVEIPSRAQRQLRRQDRIPYQKGVISSIAFNPDLSGMFAAGSYGNTIGVYSEMDNNQLLFLLDVTQQHLNSETSSLVTEPLLGSGITHLQFSTDGKLLFSGHRRSNCILCWDIRNTSRVLYSLARINYNNQRIYFDMDPSGKFLVTGSQVRYENHVLLLLHFIVE